MIDRRSKHCSTPRKTERLGLFGGPMSTTTLGLHGLSLKDALELVERKIQRAVRTGTQTLDLLFEDSPKLARALEALLTRSKAVQNFETEPGHIHLTLH